MKDRPHVVAAGGLLSRDVLNRVSTSDQTLPATNPTDYGLVQGERIGDAAARSWNRLVGVWANFRQAETRLPDTDRTATTITRERWLKPLLEELGFVALPRARDLSFAEKEYPISHEWDNTVPIHQLGWRLPVDKRTPGITGAAKTSPHSLLQEFLNRSDQHLWGIVTNGQVLRLLRDNATLTRQAYCEFDLQAIFDGDAYSDFQTLWRTCHRTRFEGTPPASCHLEKWNIESITAGTRALGQLREGVKNAIETIGTGFLFHHHNTQLRHNLRQGDLTTQRFHHQLLRLVYRMLFLLVAESRELLLSPTAGETAKRRYYHYYSISRLRNLAERRRGRTAHSDLWKSLRVTMNSLDSGSGGIPALGLVPLGSFLWSPDTIPDIHTAQIDNRHLLNAIHHLCLTPDIQAKALRPVDYKNLGSEELGSVYESLLELHPQVNVDARTFELISAAGSERKITGSYYTPTPLISRLLDETLDPLLDLAETSPDPETALLGLRILDPASGSGHFLIAAAHRIAGRLATTRTNGSEPTPTQLRTALREVIGRCVYGIDINPMAVELCKVSLWLEANHNGQPLSFLDHHIVCGNSLLGTTPELLADGIPPAAFKKRGTDNSKHLAHLRKTNLAERKQRDQGILALDWSPSDHIASLADDLAVINAGEDNTTADIDAKADLYQELQQSQTYLRTKAAADAWCAAFVIPKTPQNPAITDSTIRTIGQGHDIPPETREAITALSEEYQFLHPYLAFPDVLGRSDGFDLVVGNPPWDKIEFKETEFFATSDPGIAGMAGATRKQAIQALSRNNPLLHSSYLAAKRFNEGIRTLLATTDAYPLCGQGKINTYAVFAEFMRNATSPTGRTGMIVPTGIATDYTTRHFFADLVANRSIVSLYDFENRKKLFPAVDSRQKFCLLSLSGKQQPMSNSDFVFFAHEIADLNDPDRHYTLSSADFTLFSPNTRNCPIFRSPRDMQIARKMYHQSGVLWREPRSAKPELNPWKMSFQQGLFNMTSDSHLFRTRHQLENEGWILAGNHFTRGEYRYLPLYESKLFHQYDHRFATFEDVSPKRVRGGKPRYVTPEEKTSPQTVVIPRYWVPEEEVVERLDLSQSVSQSVRQSDRQTDRQTTSRLSHSRPRSVSSRPWSATRFPDDHPGDRREDRVLRHNPEWCPRSLGSPGAIWILVFRKIARATDIRTSIFAAIRGTAVSDSATLLNIDYHEWLQAFRGISRATDERTFLTTGLPRSGAGNSAPILHYENGPAIAAALVMANMNSLPLDWAARLSVGGTNMNFFIVKQLPVFPPEAYLKRPHPHLETYAELIVPRVLELVYTVTEDLQGFARDLGYDGPPFPWDDHRRHQVQSELDALFAYMYRLDRSDLEWILDPSAPSLSFSVLQENELPEFGEYRTKRLVLQAFDQLTGGELPNQ